MLYGLKIFILKQLLIIYCGVFTAKVKASILLGATFSPLAFIIQHITDWYITNQGTIYLFFGAIIVDWISGIWKHLKKKTFSWKLNGLGLLVKIGMVVFGSFLAESMPHFLGDNNIVTTSLITILRLSIFMYPAASAWMNMSVISNGKFPPKKWIDKLESFNKNLNIKELTDDNN